MATKLYKLKDIIDQMALTSGWSHGRSRCISCRRTTTGDKLSTALGTVCAACVATEMKKTARTVEINAWKVTQCLEALETTGDIRSRLTVLWRFKDVTPRALENPARMEKLQQLLIQNLGFVQDHPLAQFVRQAAFDACTRMGKALVPLLIEMCQPNPWQLYANIVMTLGNIDPDYPEALALIEKAAQDKNHEIRARAQAVLVKRKGMTGVVKTAPPAVETKPKKLTKQERQQAVLKTFGPPVRDLVTVGTEKKQAPAPTGELLRLETPAEKKMEGLVNTLYNINELKRLYKHYLQQGIFSVSDFKAQGTFNINKLKKTELIRPLAKVYANKDLFLRLFEKLPEAVREIFQTLVWEGAEREVEALEKTYKIKIAEKTKKYSYGNPAKDLYDDFLIFQFRTQYVWAGASGHSYRYYFSISEKLRKLFKQYLPMPPEAELNPLETIEKPQFLYEDQDRILTHIKLYHSYIEQGNLNYSKSTGKLLKSSLTQMTKYCHIQDFYDGKDKNLLYFKTRLIIDFLQGVHYKTTEPDPLEFLKRLVQDFFQNTHAQSPELYTFLYHLKGRYFEYQYINRQKRVKKSLLKLLKALPPSQWITIKNLEKYCLYQDIDIKVTDKGYNSELYFNLKKQGPYRNYHERVHARGGYYKDAVLVPFLKTMMFLFTSLGLVDIAYDRPENDILQEREQDYLSPFDGLRAVRLTELGAYVVGRTRKYEAKIQESTAKIELDDRRLILTIDGRDPLKTLIIEKVADRISENCYKVNYQSFLKECSTKKEITQKVELFHEHISAKPPHNWQEFLDEVVEKINPLVKKQKLTVFKLKQSQELISLAARDDVLKRHILKAEDYHILIEEKNIPTVKKRLEEFGYFIDNI